MHIQSSSIFNEVIGNKRLTLSTVPLLPIAVSQLSRSEQAQMEALMQRRQMKDFTRLYTGLVERCFGSCVDDFTSKVLTNREDECIQKCTNKFLKHSERVGARFQEENQKMVSSRDESVLQVSLHGG